MREIKFRAWDGKRIIYIGHERNDTALWFAEDYWEVVDHFTGEKEGLMQSDVNKDAVLMQFTGLHDKNGEEIYEGDIIDIGFRKRTVVTFQDGCFRAKYGVSNYRLAGWKSVEVIGNIYESPELLKPTNA